MNRPLKIVLALSFCLTVPFAWAEKKHLQPGEWEITTKMELVGSAMQMPPMTIRKCITPEESQKPVDLFRNKRPGRDDCETKVVKEEGNTFSWTVDCKAQGKGSGTVTYAAGHYEGTTQMEMVDKSGVTRKMKSTLSGRRVGDCAAQ